MPEMRASQLKADLQALADLGHELSSRILADLRPQTLRSIEQASRMDWLPIEVDLELVRVIHAAAGDDGLRRWGRGAVERTTGSSLLRPLAEAISRVFGLSPTSLFRGAAQAWQATFRGCGALKVVEEGPGRAVMELRDLPPELGDRSFLLSISGSLEAVYALCRVSGEVRLAEPAGEGAPRFLASWKA